MATEAAAAEAVVFDTTMLSILFTLPEAGVRPVNEVVPLKVQATLTAVEAGSTYAVLPLMTVTLTTLGFAMTAP